MDTSKGLSDSGYVKCSLEKNTNSQKHHQYTGGSSDSLYMELRSSDYEKIRDSAIISESTKSDHEYFMPVDIQYPKYPKPDYDLSDSQCEKPVQVVHPFQFERPREKNTNEPKSLHQLKINPQLPERKRLEKKRSKRPLFICCFLVFLVIIASSVVTAVVLIITNKDTPETNANKQISSDVKGKTSLPTTGILETTASKLTETITTPTTTNTLIITTTPMVRTTTKEKLTTQTTATTLTEKTTLITRTKLPTTKETTTSITTTPTIKLTTTTSESDISIVERYKDCKELYQQGYTTTGVYTIYPYLPVIKPVEVYCDMTTDGGGWTVFQHRRDGSVDYFWFWSNYKSGIGQPQGEHWLGNDHLHQLTILGASDLYVRLEKFSGGWFYAKYKDFRIANETDGYRMRLKEGSYQGNAGDSITRYGSTNANGQKFSTIDVDNDFAEFSCALARKGAWWHNKCTWANLNGVYGNGSCVKAENCNFWYSLTNSYIGVKTSFMMVRRV